MKYEKMIQSILKEVGGQENQVSYTEHLFRYVLCLEFIGDLLQSL